MCRNPMTEPRLKNPCNSSQDTVGALCFINIGSYIHIQDPIFPRENHEVGASLLIIFPRSCFHRQQLERWLRCRGAFGLFGDIFLWPIGHDSIDPSRFLSRAQQLNA